MLDFYSYSQKSYDPFTNRKITASELRSCAKAQDVEFKYGDILIVRTGWSEAYKSLNENKRKEMGANEWHKLAFAGLDRGLDTVTFLHDNYFSAVAGDAPAFETWPFDEPDHLHHFLLPLWGVPIGEMWDLDYLTVLCKKHNRYTFFFTSSPANVRGKSWNPASCQMLPSKNSTILITFKGESPAILTQ